jgi:hypothetical protein
VGLTPNAERSIIFPGAKATLIVLRAIPNGAFRICLALPTGAALAQGSGCPGSLRLQERVFVGLICFIVLAMVAYQFGLLVLIWRR